MITNLSSAEIGKFISAFHALNYVESGMKIGLGTGSTAAWLVRLLADAQKNQGLNFDAVATSKSTTDLAQSLGLKIHHLDDLGQLDLVIDGADEFDPDLNLVKGGGGALLQEKIVETAADKLVIITDASKQVKKLGAFPLPLEIIKFGWQTTQRLIEGVLRDLNFEVTLVLRRMLKDVPVTTDEGHYIFDLHLKEIDNPVNLSQDLLGIAGVVETGLFLNMTTAIIVGDGAGVVRVQEQGLSDWVVKSYDISERTELINRVKE